MELSNRIQLLIGTALVFLLIATREYHFATLHNLPGASWAVFFLAGFYLKPKWVLPALLLVAWLIDFSAFNWGSGSDYCLTPAYLFLIPAYSTLWFSGFWFSKQYRFSFRSLPTLILTILVSAFICELLSSGSFYLFSGYFSPLSLSEFIAREIKYFPAYLLSIYFYIIIATIIHIYFCLTTPVFQRHKNI